ncbi:MAG: hypothetical protein LC098_04075 [Burkholderiales bacterium]|nr:hypothetical protein [Burkholderiales bacterium]
MLVVAENGRVRGVDELELEPEIVIVLSAAKLTSAERGEHVFQLLDDRRAIAMPRSLQNNLDLLQRVRVRFPVSQMLFVRFVDWLPERPEFVEFDSLLFNI